MNFEERGFYLHLLLMQWKTGPLTEKAIRFHLGSYSVSIWEAIKDKFEVDEEGRFFNRKMAETCEAREKRSLTNTENGEKGGRPPKNKDSKKDSRIDDENQFENQNQNQIGNRNNNQKETDSNTIILYNSNDYINSNNSSIEGGVGGDSKVAYPMNYWENLYKEFHDAYGPYGYPWKKWDVIENLRLATKTIIHEWDKMSIDADYTKAGEFLIECAKLSQESDRNAKRDKRKAPHNWLADQNYMTNPHDVAPKQMTESEKLLEAIKKANANRHTA